MNIMPAFILSAISVIVNVAGGIYGAVMEKDVSIAVRSFVAMFAGMYMTMFVLGAVTTVTEWKRIHTPAFKKIAYVFTFPVFMFTYLPISLAAMFMKVEWKPIRHNVSMKVIKTRQISRNIGLFENIGN